MKDLHLISIMYPINKFHHLTLKLPWVIKTEFLLTISIQYQYNIKLTNDKNRDKYQLEGYLLIQYQIL